MDKTTEVSSQDWLLVKYAYHMDQENWKVYNRVDDILRLALTSTGHLAVTIGGKVMESHFLVGAAKWMRGMGKGDSLLLVCKYKDRNRRFRIKFAGGETLGSTACDEATKLLTKYIPIKHLSEDGTQLQDEPAEAWQGDIALAQLAKVALGELSPALPLAYQDSELPEADLNLLVRLCLTDMTFPAFVGSVQKELRKAMEETK